MSSHQSLLQTLIHRSLVLEVGFLLLDKFISSTAQCFGQHANITLYCRGSLMHNKLLYSVKQANRLVHYLKAAEIAISSYCCLHFLWQVDAMRPVFWFGQVTFNIQCTPLETIIRGVSCSVQDMILPYLSYICLIYQHCGRWSLLENSCPCRMYTEEQLSGFWERAMDMLY